MRDYCSGAHTQAVQLIRSLLHECVGSRSRVLVCFDFAYGYPVDFAAALESATGKSDLPWRLVWQYLSETVKDDIGTLPDRQPSNRSNQFETANLINSALSTSRETAGPFWCSAAEAAYLHIPQRQPEQPFVSAQGYLIKPLRLTDKRAKSGTPFRLFGTVSVGGRASPEYLASTNCATNQNSHRARPFGRSRRVGLSKLAGFLSTFQSFTQKSIRALENQSSIR